MAYEFHLPDIGEGLTEATVVKWLVAAGDEVGTDQPIVEMETDKAVVEIPAPVAGTILHLGAAAGETILVDALLVVIGETGEEYVPGAAEPAPKPAVAPPPPKTDEAAPIVGTLEEADEIVGVYPDHKPGPRHNPMDSPLAGESAAASAADGGGSITPALPLVRRLAATLGVDLSQVRGTGPGGRVTREDVEAVAATSDGVRRTRMSPTRQAIARNLARSWHEIPHVTTYGEADAAALLAARKEAGVPLEALLMERVVPLLREHPEFNAAVDGDDVLYKEVYDLGFAVDTPNGLMVAVVRGADALDTAAIGSEITRLAAAAKDRTITPAEMRGATFTISNIGAVGGRFGTPIIPYGTSAILSIGRADERAVARDGEVVVAREFPLSLSYDHRIIDGAAGRAFLSAVIEVIEAG
jgi:pyruvate dehydrogenase E2 component (dihydrolipoamide acetyltransferase)